jgi:hypothetical protein
MDPEMGRDDSDQRKERDRVSMSRVLRGGEKDDGTFDLKFWQTVGAEGIFAAAWDMVREHRSFRGDEVDEPRLQRSVLRVVRRGR